MGFTVYYRSTTPQAESRSEEFKRLADQLCSGRTWLSCEPVSFFGLHEGHILGGSKPNILPRADEVAAANSEGLPDGTIRDAIDVLCQISKTCQVDWQINHDESSEPVGYIQNGTADAALDQFLAEFDLLNDLDLGDMESWMGGDESM